MSDDVRVTIDGQEVALSVEDAEALRKSIWEQTYPILNARKKAALQLAREEGRLWLSAVKIWGATDEEVEEHLTRNEALGTLRRVGDADAGYPLRMVEPDGTIVEGDVLEAGLDNLYGEDGNYRIDEQQS